ncbi:MAG: hypothetical protein WDN28_10610 [Chthoniobacter sp.]
MKMLSFLSAMVLAATVLAKPARADEPPLSDVTKLTPQIQAMLAELYKAANLDPAADAPTPAASTSTPIPSAPAAPAAPPVKMRAPLSTALHTSSLRTGGLTTSGSLGGHGALDGAPRLTSEEWRELFPVRK